MKNRVLFGVGGFVFVLLALYVLPPIVWALTVTILCGFAAHELLSATKLVQDMRMRLVCVFGAFLYAGGMCIPEALGIVVAEAFLQQGMLLVFLVTLFLCFLRRHAQITFEQVAVGFFAAYLLPQLLLALWRIFVLPGGQFLVLLPLVAAWGSDTCALFAGMLFGKHKLAPVISPKKTIEGAIGGVIGATGLMILVIFLLNRFAGVQVHYLGAAIMGAAGAILGQIGDLSFSVIKRQTGIKDYGKIFPGHGGVLDRFDSVIFVTPVVELVLAVLGSSL